MGQEWEDVLIKEKILSAALLLFLGLSIALGGAAAWFKLQRDNAILKLSEYQLQVENAAKTQEIRVKVLNEQSQRQLKQREEEYAKSIITMQDEITKLVKESSGLIGGNARLVNLNAGLLDAANSTRRALSEMVAASSALAGSGANSDERLENEIRAREALEIACTQTTIDYDELRYWVEDQGKIYGWAD